MNICVVRRGALGALCMALACFASATPLYHVVNLGTLNSGDTGSTGFGMNATNESVGASYASDTTSAPFYANGSGVMSAIQQVGSSTAYGINDGDMIVGVSGEGTNQMEAVQWAAGSAFVLPGLTANSLSAAYAVNNSGMIAGVSTDVNGVLNLVVWQSGAIVHNAVQTSATNLTVTGIDAAGDVVGTSSLGAYVWNATNGFVTLSGTNSGAAGIAANGSTILGYDTPVSSGVYQPVSWNSVGQETVLSNIYTDDFGALSSAVAMNTQGDIVGYDGFGDGEIWSGGQVYSLSGSLDAASAGWLIGQTYAINDHGTILAVGINSSTGVSTAVMLQAVPEPMSLAVLGAAGLALLRRRRRS